MNSNLKSVLACSIALIGSLNAHSADTSLSTSEMVNITTISDEEHYDAGVIASIVISKQRQLCGLGPLSYDKELLEIASSHGKYLNHMQRKMDISKVDSHFEETLKGYEKFTGRANPYFTGYDFTDRVLKANYQNAIYGGSENIIQEEVLNKDGLVPSPSSVAKDFANGLLSAPYHMQSLLAPNNSLIGTSLMTYTPYTGNVNSKKVYSLVSAISGSENSSKNTIDGLFTYPCEGVSGTVTALYNESPSPVAGTGRNLRIDPIGQPIYINMPSHEIKISNVTISDTQRDKYIPTEIIDHTNDPHKNTENALLKSKAFILPITDDIVSCNSGKYTNCGLNSNTQYRVSFDVLVDNKRVIKHSFSFRTGDTNR